MIDSSNRHRAFRAAGSWMALIGIFAGVPAILITLVGWPLPRTMPTAAGLHRWLSGPLADGVVVKAIAAVAWLAWLQLVVALAAEISAVVHGRGPRRVAPAGVQRLVGQLVAAALVLVVPTAASTTADAAPLPVSTPLPSRAVAAPMLLTTPPQAPGSAPTPMTVNDPATAAGVPSSSKYVTVVPGDTLWGLAETHLGNGERATDIWNLNRGRLMSTDQTFARPSLIRPGWTLIMPADAVGTQVGPSPASQPPSPYRRPPTQPAASAAPPPESPTTSVPMTIGRGHPRPQAETWEPTRTLRRAPPTSAGSAAGNADHKDGASGSGLGNPVREQPEIDVGKGQDKGSARRPSIPIAPVAGFAGLVAGGVIWKLDRRRRQAMFTRRRGRTIPPPTPAAEHVERQARAIADCEAVRWVDLGLRYLGRVIDEELAGPAPSVVVVRAGSQGLEIMIDPPAPAGAGRFEAIDDGRVWRIDPDVDLAELEVLAGDRWPIVPALVSVGTSTDGAVLANLEHAGSVAVEGDPVMVTAVLQQVLVELASYPWSEETLAGLHTFGDPHLSDLPPGVTPVPDEMAIAEVVDRLADRYRRDLADRPSAAAARAVDAGWEPHVTVAFPDADPRSLRCLLEAATPDNSGAVAVCAASDLPARWRLHVSGDGTAFLDGMAGEDPFHLALHIEARSENLAALSAGLAMAAAPGDAAPVIDLRASPVDHQSERGLVEIGILGGIEVIGGTGIEAIEARRRTSALAVLVYLVTHRQPVSTADLTQALWPLDPSKVDFGEPSKSAVNNAVSQARKILGRDPNGEDLLVYNREGYRLGRSVTCDWDRLQHLTAIAAHRTPPDGLAIYREALELVRATPLQGALNSPRFEWVSREHLDITIICRVVDAAESLAESALALEDYPTVQWAVSRGLELDPAREQLYQYWMHALGRSGSTERLNEVYGRLCTMLRRRIHELQDPTDESRDIWQSYTGKRAARQ